MGTGTAFGKSILIGDQFVLEEVPAIISAIPFVTECVVERLPEGSGWNLEDNRTEVPGYKEKKKHQQVDSINHVLEVMKIDVKKTHSKSPTADRCWPAVAWVPVLPVVYPWPGR